MKQMSYFDKRSQDCILKQREILRTLPEFCEDFFIGIENQTSPLTRLNYARDLVIFFNWLKDYTNIVGDRDIKDLQVEDLKKVKSTHIDRFLSYLSTYRMNGKVITNGERGKSRKLSAIRSFFKYFYNRDFLDGNVASKVDMPKIHDKAIIRLEVDEVARLLDEADLATNMTRMQQGFHTHTRLRDVAMLTLLLGTGIRVSECVGLNIDDVDFSINAIRITRKGGNQVMLYFSDEIENALQAYLAERNENKVAKENGEEALFLSLQNKRITVRAVQLLVKKYASIITPLKKITPHKLRSTYGTALYHETQDIYIVADVLGHKDINTTKRHYAAVSDDIRRSAAGKVRLRDMQ